MLHSSIRRCTRELVVATALLFCASTGSMVCAQTPSNARTEIQPGDFIQRIDAAVNARHNGLAGYTVNEHYAIFRNADKNPVAEMTVRTVYTQAGGKEYTPISQSGSEFLRRAIIEKVLANEHEVNKVENRAGSWINSANYEFQVNPVKVTYSGRECYLVALKARRKGPSLFDGKAWFDVSDGTIVRLEGSPTQAPNFLAGETTVARDYAPQEGFAMATHAEAHSHSFLLGDTFLKIDYTGYQLQLAQTAELHSGDKH